MGKSYSLDLRERVVEFVRCGHSRKAAARHFGVSASFSIKLLQRVEREGSCAPKPQGRPAGSGKLGPHAAFLIAAVEAKPDITMPELAALLERERGVSAAPCSLSQFLCKHGFTYKKTLLASEAARATVSHERHIWTTRRQPRMRLEPDRLVFVDETSITTRMVRLRGRSLRGTRLRAEAPFGRWGTQTFIAALRLHGLTAPWVVDKAIDRHLFDVWVETQLAPSLSAGDVVILDNLAVHKSARAADCLRSRGAWFLFLPPYSPDLNPIEMAFAKIKAHLRAAAARTFDGLSAALGSICDLFDPDECWNYLRHSGYAYD
ncbi:IS630 family transposase [Caenispirillum bisanense]|uniref:IS630 family transposase n=1 Tax=Caenispirillum bisanense TaxID=414052 RepID=UPI0031DD7F60